MTDVEQGEASEEKPRSMIKGQTAESLERDAQALRMRSFGYSLAQIDAQLNYRGTGNVSTALKRATNRVLKAPVMEYVAVEQAKLDQIALHLIGILHRSHVVVSGGKIVRDDETGEPLKDDGPELRALSELVKVSESKRRLMGLDAAVKLDINLDDDPVNRELAILVQAMESRGRAQEQAVKRGER